MCKQVRNKDIAERTFLISKLRFTMKFLIDKFGVPVLLSTWEGASTRSSASVKTKWLSSWLLLRSL